MAAIGLLLLAGATGAWGEGEPWLVDVAPETGIDFVHFNGMVGELYFSEIMGSGVGLLDYDGDGDLDVYWVQGAAQGEGEAAGERPIDRLFRCDRVESNGELALRFVDVTARSGLEARGYGMGVAAGDVDNDGWTDLFVTNLGANELWRNRGDGTFVDATAQSGVGDRRWGVSASFFDYDADGWLDLFVGNYVGFRVALHKACFSPTGISDYCGPLAYEPEPDVLYRNRGDGTFEDVTARTGLSDEPPGSSLGSVAADFDGDGRLDLYVANDQLPNRLWLQTVDGRFVNDALMTGTAVNEEGQPEASMGLVAGDFDRDGAVDLFMSHLTRETNTLYLNDGSGLFRDSTRDSGLGQASWQATGFGVGLLDLDSDGWLDLFIANGAVRRLPDLLAAGDPYPLRQADLLFQGLGGGAFADVTEVAGVNAAPLEVGRGVATGDVDNDGDPDLVVSNNAGPGRLLLNRTPRTGTWLGLRAAGAAGGDALGARFELRAGDSTLHARSRTDGSYASSNDPRAHVGLGDHSGPVEVSASHPWIGRRRFLSMPTEVWLTIPTVVGRRP